MQINKEIKIICDAKLYIPMEDLFAFQGNLKDLYEEDFEKLYSAITTLGWATPISVWKNYKDGKWYILDGHQRVRVLEKLIEEGYLFPDGTNRPPCIEIVAINFDGAKKLLLTLASTYGKATTQGLYEYLETHPGIDLAFLKHSVKIPEINLEKFKSEYYEDIVNKIENDYLKDEPKAHKTTHCPHCGKEL